MNLLVRVNPNWLLTVLQVNMCIYIKGYCVLVANHKLLFLAFAYWICELSASRGNKKLTSE